LSFLLVLKKYFKKMIF